MEKIKPLSKYCVSKVRLAFERKPVLMFANVLRLGEVPPCRMFKFSTKACGGILQNHCYKPFFRV